MKTTWNDMTALQRAANTYLDCLVDEWHAAKDDARPLHEALGMTWDEYKAWTEDSTAIPQRYLDQVS